MNRRRLLSLGAAALPVLGLRAWAAPEASSPRFLLVFLRGGYDALSAVVPISSDFYAEARPGIRIARPDPADPNAARRLDADWGLHPALAEPLTPLWSSRQLAFVPFAGPDDLSRSHFATQDLIELGQPFAARRDLQSGFLSRLAQHVGGARPIAFSDQLPLILRGGAMAPNIAVSAIGKPGLDDRQSKLIAAMYRDTPLAPAVSEGFSVRDEAYASMAGEMAAAGRGAPVARGFELAARRVGRMLASDYSLGFLDVGGWDTHVNQPALLAPRLGELGRGLASLAEEMGPAWRNTVVVVISEFGRTFRENGGRGTDHGHGSVYWVLGGGLHGGVVAGPQVKFAPETLNQGRDLPVLTDYRALLGGLFARQYGLSPDQIAQVFPGDARPVDLGLI